MYVVCFDADNRKSGNGMRNASVGLTLSYPFFR